MSTISIRKRQQAKTVAQKQRSAGPRCLKGPFYRDVFLLPNPEVDTPPRRSIKTELVRSGFKKDRMRLLKEWSEQEVILNVKSDFGEMIPSDVEMQILRSVGRELLPVKLMEGQKLDGVTINRVFRDKLIYLRPSKGITANTVIEGNLTAVIRCGPPPSLQNLYDSDASDDLEAAQSILIQDSKPSTITWTSQAPHMGTALEETVESMVDPLVQVLSTPLESLTKPTRKYANHHVTCDVCGKSFGYRGSMKRHKLTHNNIRRFECKVCAAKFYHKTNLDEHVLIRHTGIKAFECGICHATFHLRVSLLSHLLTHTQERSFACHHCTKRFKYKAGLIAHISNHFDFRRVVCHICGRGFNTKWHLKRHMTVHSRGMIGCDSLTGREKQPMTTVASNYDGSGLNSIGESQPMNTSLTTNTRSALKNYLLRRKTTHQIKICTTEY